MKSAETIVKNSFFLTLGTIISKCLTFVYIAIVARMLGIEAFGKYSFALSLVMMLSILSDLGLSVFLFREIARQKEHIASYVGNVFIMRLVTGFVFLILINSFSVLAHYDNEKKILILVLSLWIFFLNLSQVFRAAFKAMEKMIYEARSEVFDNIMRLVFVVAFLKIGFGVVGVVLSLLLASLIVLIYSIYIFQNHFSGFRFHLDFDIWFEAAKQIMPLSLAAILITYFGRMDNIILSHFKGYAAVGLYDASCRFVWMLIFIPAYLTHSTFPKLSETAARDHDRFKKLLAYLIKFNLVMTIPMTILIFILSPKIIYIIYGAGFSSSNSILRILIWTFPIHAVIGALVYALYAMNKQHINSLFISIALFVNLLLDIFLVNALGYWGIAYSTLGSLILLCYLLFRYSLKNSYFDFRSLRFTKDDFSLAQETISRLISRSSRIEVGE